MSMSDGGCNVADASVLVFMNVFLLLYLINADGQSLDLRYIIVCY